jgi:hypothetical protein
LRRTGGGTIELSFEPLAAAQRYNLYVGRLASLQSGSYDHGREAPAGPVCDAPTQLEATGRLKIVRTTGEQTSEDAYYLVTAHVDDVESPAGHDSDAVEIDRSASICR